MAYFKALCTFPKCLKNYIEMKQFSNKSGKLYDLGFIWLLPFTLWLTVQWLQALPAAYWLPQRSTACTNNLPIVLATTKLWRYKMLFSLVSQSFVCTEELWTRKAVFWHIRGASGDQVFRHVSVLLKGGKWWENETMKIIKHHWRQK